MLWLVTRPLTLPHSYVTAGTTCRGRHLTTVMEVNARKHETPEVLPWIPPGQSIEETNNKFAHKKGSIASKINAEVAAKKKNLQSPDKKKKSSTFSTLSKGSSDSGIDSANDLSQSFRKHLKGEILQIFDEDENGYNGENDRRRFVESNFEMSDRNVDISRHRDRRIRESSQQRDQTDSDSETEEERRLSRRSEEFSMKMKEFLRKEGKFQRMDNISTGSVLGQQGLDSLEFNDDDYERRKQSFERGNQSNRSSFRNLDNSFISPRTNLTESFASRPSR